MDGNTTRGNISAAVGGHVDIKQYQTILLSLLFLQSFGKKSVDAKTELAPVFGFKLVSETRTKQD